MNFSGVSSYGETYPTKPFLPPLYQHPHRTQEQQSSSPAERTALSVQSYFPRRVAFPSRLHLPPLPICTGEGDGTPSIRSHTLSRQQRGMTQLPPYTPSLLSASSPSDVSPSRLHLPPLPIRTGEGDDTPSIRSHTLSRQQGMAQLPPYIPSLLSASSPPPHTPPPTPASVVPPPLFHKVRRTPTPLPMPISPPRLTPLPPFQHSGLPKPTPIRHGFQQASANTQAHQDRGVLFTHILRYTTTLPWNPPVEERLVSLEEHTG